LHDLPARFHRPATDGASRRALPLPELRSFRRENPVRGADSAESGAEMSLLLGRFRWYRRLRGGTWYLALAPDLYAPVGTWRFPLWINERPPYSPILEIEHYD
jgi:hypothetical protein